MKTRQSAARVATALGAAALLALSTFGAQAETRITYKSAKSTSSYFQMAVQVAEAVKAATGGEMTLTVEESQGSVQNVKEAAKRPGNYVFTTPPGLIKLALGGKKMFEGAGDQYAKIRSLFPIPSLTMHFVVRVDAGIDKFADLDGKDFLIGKGSFGAREAAKNLAAFGLEGKVNLIDTELNAAVPALKNRQVHGFATAGSYPAPNVLEAAASGGVKLLSMSDEQVETTKRRKLVIPAGTYPGVDSDTVTTTLAVGAYTTADMTEDAAYKLVKAFWSKVGDMGATNPWWKAVTPGGLATLGTTLHPGALKYYKEAGITVPERLM